MSELAESQRIMSKRDSDRLDFIDIEIECRTAAYLDVGNLLREVAADKLWRRDFESFEVYVEQRHKMSRQHAYRLMDACVVVANLSTKCTDLPAVEKHVRPLAAIADPDKQCTAWNKVQAFCKKHNVSPTFELVTKIVAEYLNPKPIPTTIVVYTTPDDARDASDPTGQLATNSSSGQDSGRSVTPGVTPPVSAPPIDPDDPTAAEGDVPHEEDGDVVLSRKAIRALLKHVVPKITEHAIVVDRVLRALGKPGADLDIISKNQQSIIECFEKMKKDLQ